MSLWERGAAKGACADTTDQLGTTQGQNGARGGAKDDEENG